MRTEVHDLTIWAGHQSLSGTLIDHEHFPKLRASIERDAYDRQSHAHVEAWTTETGWKVVHSVPITNMAISDYSYSYGKHARDHYAAYTVLGKKGLPFWTDVIEDDLNQLMDYGRRFFYDT